MKRVLLVVALTTAFSLPALAEGDATAKALELSRLVVTQSMYKDMLDKMVQAMAANFPPEQQRSPEFWKKFRTELDKIIPHQEMLDDQTALLVKYYDAAEIDQLIAFYKSPVGQKALKIMPEVMADVTATMQVRLRERLPAAIDRLVAEDDAEKKPAEGSVKPAVAPAKAATGNPSVKLKEPKPATAH